MRSLFALAVIVASASLAVADVVTLTNGNVFEGKVLEDSDARVVIDVRGGKLTFPRHLVKTVVKKALKPRPRREPPKATTQRKQAPIRDKRGRGPNLWSELAGVAAMGERFEFRYAFDEIPEEKLTSLERLGKAMMELEGAPRPSTRGGKLHLPEPKEVRLPKGAQVEVTWVGLEELRYTARARGTQLPKSMSGPREGKWRRVKRRYDWPPKGARQETITVSGRAFPCVVIEKTYKSGRVDKEWVHVREGRVAWPRVIKHTVDGVSVRELVQILPAPKDTILPPNDPGAVAGDVLTKRVKYQEFRTHVLKVWGACPTEVGQRTEVVKSKGGNWSVGGGWKWSPQTAAERFKGRIMGRETLTIKGRSYPCVVVRKYRVKSKESLTSRTWYHVGEDGRVRYPGRVRVEKSGEIIEEVLDFQPAK